MALLLPGLSLRVRPFPRALGRPGWIAAVALMLWTMPGSAQAADPQRLFQEAVTAQQQGDNATAARDYRELLRMHPEATDVRINLAATLANLGRFSEAIEQCSIVLAADPSNRMARVNLRIQALAMNEAARMVEEGVASAEDIEPSIRYGFGFRYGGAGPSGIHRLGRRRYPLLRQPYLPRARLVSDRIAAPEVDRAQHARRPHRAAHRCRLPRLFRSRCRRLSRATPSGAGRYAQACRTGAASGAGQGLEHWSGGLVVRDARRCRAPLHEG